MIVHFNSVAAHDRLIANFDIVVVKYGAVWCKPCVRLGVELSEMASEFESVTFASVDVDKVKHFRGCALPTVRIYENGEEIDFAVGGSTGSFIRDSLKEMVIRAKQP